MQQFLELIHAALIKFGITDFKNADSRHENQKE